ncbi:hypothetical protein FACS189445_1200 [Spirochaetia bacterium]|nr:hypothetical protein FACS189445_1200 [Spirochaetia bacterium]
MILYHGSFLEVKKPDVGYSRDRLDFGRGFYLTPIKEQAINWTMHFLRRYGKRIVSIYEFNETTDLRVLNFPTYNEDWLDFITLCRLGIGNNNQYDLIIGSVANDRVFDALEAYFGGYSDKTQAIQKLRYQKPNLQYCFVNQETIDKCLHFISAEVIE